LRAVLVEYNFAVDCCWSGSAVVGQLEDVAVVQHHQHAAVAVDPGPAGVVVSDGDGAVPWQLHAVVTNAVTESPCCDHQHC